jgi:hypothetical protein
VSGRYIFSGHAAVTSSVKNSWLTCSGGGTVQLCEAVSVEVTGPGQAVAVAGAHDYAHPACEQGRAAIREITDSNTHAQTLTELAEAVATTGDYDRVDRLAHKITNPTRAWALKCANLKNYQDWLNRAVNKAASRPHRRRSRVLTMSRAQTFRIGGPRDHRQ